MSTTPLALNSHAGYKIADETKRGYKLVLKPNKTGLKVSKAVILTAAETIFPDIKVIEGYEYGNQTFTLIGLPKSVKITTQEKRQEFLANLTEILRQPRSATT